MFGAFLHADCLFETLPGQVFVWDTKKTTYILTRCIRHENKNENSHGFFTLTTQKNTERRRLLTKNVTFAAKNPTQ